MIENYFDERFAKYSIANRTYMSATQVKYHSSNAVRNIKIKLLILKKITIHGKLQQGS